MDVDGQLTESDLRPPSHVGDGDGLRSSAALTTDDTPPQTLGIVVRQILDAVGAATGAEYFQTLAEQLCRTCQVAIAGIAKIDSARPNVAQTIAFVRGGEILPNVSYDL